MKMQYCYKAYDLIFFSEMRIPELPEAEGDPHVVIRLGRVPESLKNPKETARRFQASELEFLLKVDQVAQFYIKDGNEITIEPMEGSSELDIRLFLLGSAFGALLQQREGGGGISGASRSSSRNQRKRGAFHWSGRNWKIHAGSCIP